MRVGYLTPATTISSHGSSNPAAPSKRPSSRRRMTETGIEENALRSAVE